MFIAIKKYNSSEYRNLLGVGQIVDVSPDLVDEDGVDVPQIRYTLTTDTALQPVRIRGGRDALALKIATAEYLANGTLIIQEEF